MTKLEKYLIEYGIDWSKDAGSIEEWAISTIVKQTVDIEKERARVRFLTNKIDKAISLLGNHD